MDFSELAKRRCPAWYARPQLGVFIHWGMFAVPAFAPRGASITDLSRTDYDRLFAKAPYAEWYWNAMRLKGSETAAHHRAKYGDQPYRAFRLTFEQAAEAFDANAWADLFHTAGAGYVVFVTKHHDGFCLWPTAVENPHQPGWHSKRDFVGELAEAVRARGMKFGLYYSGGLDWTFPYYLMKVSLDASFGTYRNFSDGAGSVVVADVPNGQTVFGNPAVKV